MATNPSKQSEKLESPLQRANPLNDPKFKNEQGYNVYDLNNQQIVTPRFGEYTPICCAETVPGDRHLLHTNISSVLEQIQANVQSRINEYHDHVFVPMRVVFPNNYEKMITNPTKGSDLPWRALPQIPLLRFLHNLLDPSISRSYITVYDEVYRAQSFFVSGGIFSAERFADAVEESAYYFHWVVNSLIYTSTVLSRGQLLDYLGYCPEYSSLYNDLRNVQLEKSINEFFDVLGSNLTGLESYRIDPTEGVIIDDEHQNILYAPNEDDFTLSDLRKALYDAIEAGDFIVPFIDTGNGEVVEAIYSLASSLYSFVSRYESEVDESDPFADGSYINPMRPAAYQLAVAEYCTNDHIDNVYTAQLWMQNLRAIMFPSVGGTSREPIFEYNGVEYEYDLLTTGAFDQFLEPDEELQGGVFGRQILLVNQLFILRRSLRYGDYFSTGRPELVAVGQLAIPVANNGTISPVDTVRSLVMQRFINAVNWIGSKFINYMSSIFGVKPSFTEPHPVYVAHRKIELNRDKTTNTAQDQGKVTTNLYGSTDSNAIDVYIDDFGVIIGFVSYDALPVYTTGIDRNYTNSDRYSMFNSMLQNVGDQEIALSELLGWTTGMRQPFAYTARYSQYKFAISKAHGAAVNLMPGLYMKYPPLEMFSDGILEEEDFKINPSFIRDKPAYFDQFFTQRTGFGFGSYYHFVCSVFNQHHAARKMMYQPPVL